MLTPMLTPMLTHYDLIIVGGGINGAALARLAASLGHKVGLFEAADFGHGASSNTSKLLHGGLRYLETYAFGLVGEAVRERARWLKLAPHLAQAARFHFPLVPQARHGRWMIKCGMLLYDGLAAREPESKRLGGHAWVNAQAFAESVPQLLPGEVRGAYTYADCIMDDARHCLETVLDAEALGAVVRNYHPVTHVREDQEGVDVTVLNRLTGKEMALRAKQVALLAGPWTDKFRRESLDAGLTLLQKSETSATEPWVRPSQGIHLIVDGLDARECLILPVPNTTRYFFVLPHPGYVIVGTTETEITGEMPESPRPQETEITELLGLLRLYFPKQNARLLGVFAGVRPLARVSPSKAAKLTSPLTAKVSREHVVHRIGEHMVSAVGGKYTTHRPLALDVYRQIFGREKTAHEKKAIADFFQRPLPGAWHSPAEEKALVEDLGRAGLPDALAQAWVFRYGIKARAVLDHCHQETDGLTLLPDCTDVAWGEIAYALDREYVKSPIDFLRRRTRLFFTPHAGLAALPEIEKRIFARYPEAKAMLKASADYREYLKGYRHLAMTGDGK